MFSDISANTKEYAIFLVPHGTVSKIGCMLSDKASLNRYRKVEIILCISLDPHRLNLYFNNRKSTLNSHSFIHSFIFYLFKVKNRFFPHTIHLDYSFPFFHLSQLNFPCPSEQYHTISSLEKDRIPREDSQTRQSKIHKSKVFISMLDYATQGGKESQYQTKESNTYLLVLLGVL